MRKTYEVKNESYHSPSGLVFTKDAQFSAFKEDELNRFDHLVAIGNLALVKEEPEFKEPEPPPPIVEESPIFAGEEYTVIDNMNVGLQGIVIEYKSPDMPDFIPVTGSLTVTPGVKLRGQRPSALSALRRMEAAKIIAKEQVNG